MGDTNGSETFDIPQECIGGVVVNEGQNFEVQVKQVPVPEIGVLIASNLSGDDHANISLA